jgi:hypothetical protein
LDTLERGRALQKKDEHGSQWGILPAWLATPPSPIGTPVKKTYRLDIEGKNRDRLLEASKHDIRKYLKRERNKALPAGADYWDFDTKSGVDEASAVAVAYADLFRSIDALLAEGGDQFYVEVRSKPGHRSVKAPPADVWGKLRGEPAEE